MEIKEMNKAELIAKLEEQRHLAEAVESKDKEIIDLKREYSLKISNLVQDNTQLKNKLKEEQEKSKVLEEFNKLKEITLNLQEENKKLVAHINMFVDAFRNTLKAEQGVLDNAIQLEAFISESLRRK